jgi:hypothetical protein
MIHVDLRIFRATRLDLWEHAICFSIGFSSIIFAAIVKATPEHLLEKINITVINEDKVINDDDAFMTALKGDDGSKSSTARLLDEWKS